MLLGKIWILKFYFRLHKIQTVELATCKAWMKKGYLEKNWNDNHLEEEEKEDSEFKDAGSDNRDEREGN